MTDYAKEVAQLRAEAKEDPEILITRVLNLRRENDRLKGASEAEPELKRCLRELHALVWGECPSLLNEDSGGDANLDLRIQEVLK